MYVIGRGGFGKVWKVREKKSKITFALKEMMKTKIIDKRSEKSIKYERELLEQLRHPWHFNQIPREHAICFSRPRVPLLSPRFASWWRPPISAFAAEKIRRRTNQF